MSNNSFDCPKCEAIPVTPGEICWRCGHLNDDFKKQFNWAIAQLGLSQQEAADRLGYKRSNFSHMLAGNPTKTKIEQLSTLVSIRLNHGRWIIEPYEDDDKKT